MRRRIGVFGAVLILAAGLGVSAASARAHLLVGLQDDAQTLYGDPTITFPILRQLRVQVIRINLEWGGHFGVANDRRPARTYDPSDPQYDWTLYDRAVRYAAQNNIKVMFSILFTPKWANGGKAQNVPPRNYNDLRNFAYAAAERYSGHYVPPNDTGEENPLPAVKYWLAWNEPNNPQWLQQTSGGHFTSPKTYAKICTSIWSGVHLTNFAGEQVGCGATGPQGNNQPRSSRPELTPLAFMRLAHAAGMRHLDAYAHHPYYGSPHETPATKSRGPDTVRLANMPTLVKQANRYFGKKPIWITEYGWQTPPDRQYGVSYARQARYVAQSYSIARHLPQVSMMIWFMLKDDGNIKAGWQSGFLTAGGKKKPAFNVFAHLPH